MNTYKQIAKWGFLAFLIIATIFILRRHNAPTTSEVPYQECTGKIFGTTYKAIYQHPDDLSADIHSRLNEVDASLSMFNPISTLARINKHETDTMDAMMQEVFALATRVSEATSGAFDCTVAPAVEAWGFGFKNREQITDEKIDSLKQLIGYRNVSMTADGLLKRQIEGVQMDFGAIAKGFGVDKVAELLSEKGVKNMLVEIGGEIIVHGTRADGNPWRIAVQSPTGEGFSAVLTRTETAMATSGNYLNYYVNEAGERVAHTISPFTARPVTHTLLSATVTAPTCAMADAFATAFMVMGVEQAKTVLNEYPTLGAYLIYSEGDTLQTFAKNFSLDGK